jgi:hypothetical protein
MGGLLAWVPGLCQGISHGHADTLPKRTARYLETASGNTEPAVKEGLLGAPTDTIAAPMAVTALRGEDEPATRGSEGPSSGGSE